MKSIQQRPGTIVDECKKQWKNARDRFLREKRAMPTGSQAPESTWPYFSKMLFYLKYTKPRKTSTTTKTFERPSSASSASSSAWNSISSILSPREPDDSVVESANESEHTENDEDTRSGQKPITEKGTKMRNDNGDRCVDLEHITMENNIKRHKLIDASAQTSLIVPYRLRFWPSCELRKEDESGCRCCCRIVSRWLLSQLGLTVVVTLWALLGALAFFNTEGPREREQSNTLAKLQKDLSIELATDLKKTSEHTEAWPSTIYKYFEKHEALFLEAVGAGYGEGGGGNIWTYPGCFLFAISLLTTLGFGAPVPRTVLGRGAAVIFAAIGIPLHFLLILNVGNLAAVSLRRLAFGEGHADVPVTPYPRWLTWFPVIAILIYYILGVVLFGFVRERAVVNCFMFPLDFTAAGGVATVSGVVRVFYALYLEGAVTLAALVLSLVQASAARGIVDIGLRLGLLTNT